MSNEAIEKRFPAILASLLENALGDPEGRVFKSAQRARDRHILYQLFALVTF